MEVKSFLFSSLLAIVLVGCSNPSSSGKLKEGNTSTQVAKSEVQKKAEHFMNTKSDLLHECENLYAVYKDDKFRICMSEWSDTPADTIFKSDVYKILIERQEEELSMLYYESMWYYEAVMQRLEEENRLRREKGGKFDSDFEALIRQKRHERDSINGISDSINGIITRIKNQQDWNEPYWLIYEFVEEVDRTFAISGETDKSQYPCYCIYMPSTNELVTIVEKTKYSKPHALHLLNMAL